MRSIFQSRLAAIACVGMMLLTGVSCEKMIVGEADDGQRANVVMRVGSIEQIPFPAATRATIEELCSHLCFHVYDDDGIRVDYVNQKTDNTNFGEASFLLDKGHYYLVVVGHSASKNPSFSANEKVSISGSDLGDTFWCCEDFRVEDEDVDLTLELHRIVSLVQFVSTVTPPVNMNKIVVKYKGSKGTFNGLTGYGSTDTNQTVELFPSSEDRQYEFYLIPRAESDAIDITFNAYYVDENERIRDLGGCKINGVPVKRNTITVCRGNLFDESNKSISAFVTVSIDDSWSNNIQIDF